MKKSLTVLAAALIAFASQAGAASWQADNADIDFLSIKVNQKKRSVTEESNFTASTARLEADGSFTLNVDLKSVKPASTCAMNACVTGCSRPASSVPPPSPARSTWRPSTNWPWASV